ncbi:hypothetical protein BaRGS_00002870 [Batillaria attramentaria]|uniref:Uncharacterized protein n=1 Tax=Batillaria attramentaria TaxID=370345 RepID=A0ABD0M4E5_9CAEN
MLKSGALPVLSEFSEVSLCPRHPPARDGGSCVGSPKHSLGSDLFTPPSTQSASPEVETDPLALFSCCGSGAAQSALWEGFTSRKSNRSYMPFRGRQSVHSYQHAADDGFMQNARSLSVPMHLLFDKLFMRQSLPYTTTLGIPKSRITQLRAIVS